MQFGFGVIGLALLIVVAIILASAPVVRHLRSRRRHHW